MFKRELEIKCDPIAYLKKAAGLPGLVLLHSGMNAYGLGQYSILTACPWKTFGYRDGISEVTIDGKVNQASLDLFGAMERAFEGEDNLDESSDLPFYSGAIGYLSYDAGRYLERIKGSSGNGYDARFGFYRAAVVFDHETDKVFLVGNSEGPAELLYSQIESSNETNFPQFDLKEELVSNFTREQYCDVVERVRNYIREGEVYQVNLSQRFEGSCSGSSVDLFIRLAKLNGAPYAAYMDFGDEQIVSSSPERFLKVSDGVVTTRPIKGTRSAGNCELEAAANARELSKSEKDNSELLMILDLERNDIGRVCRPGSVKVDSLFAIERYATVIHQTAEVSGELDEGVSVLDCIKALFPGGSITGAPKIRAMEVIAELEKGPRGIYTGAIGYLNSAGEADFNIAIRTIRVADGRLSFQVGGGIVWDSEAESEYEETLLKGKAMKEAIGGNHER